MTLRERREIQPDGRVRATRPSFLAGAERSGCRVVSGRVNGHDHLEFALFPRLGRGPYRNARQWADAIQHEDADVIAHHRRVPREDRLRWGGLKNLLSAATTVYEHNAYRADVFDNGFPVRVARCGWAHSLHFSPDLAEAYARRPEGLPFFVHAGEGTDAGAAEEVFELDRIGALRPDTWLVHATAFDAEGWELLERRGAGVVWCPTSNRFTLGRTLAADRVLGSKVRLGTDSPLTAAGDLFDELAEAARLVGPERAEALVRGEEATADWAVFEGDDTLRREALKAVAVDGRWRLLEAGFAAERGLDVAGMQPLAYDDRRYWVRFDVVGLLERTRAVLGDDFRLAGKRTGLWG